MDHCTKCQLDAFQIGLKPRTFVSIRPLQNAIFDQRFLFCHMRPSIAFGGAEAMAQARWRAE
jgi:hypothetical protein